MMIFVFIAALMITVFMAIAVSRDAVQAGKIEEPSITVDQTVGANAVNITQSGDLPNNWRGRILRIVATNLDNNVRQLSLYSGDTVTQNRTLLKTYSLSNYQTRIIEVIEPEKDQVGEWGVTTDDEDNRIYGLVDAVTNGVLIEEFHWIQEEA